MSRTSTIPEVEGYTEEFRELLFATPMHAKDADGIDRDVSPSVRINMALTMWLARQTVHGAAPAESPELRQPNRFGHL